MPTALVTGSAGFIGFHVSKVLLDDGWCVVGLDCLTEYYDVSLKQAREQILLQHLAYKSIRAWLESDTTLLEIFEREVREMVINLAAPFRLVNVGNNSPVDLSELVAAIEQATGKGAVSNLMPIQPGGVSATWADSSLLCELTGYKP